MTTMTKSFGTFEGDPAVWTDAEAWVLTNGVWHANIPFAMWDEAAVMTEAAWTKAFPDIMKTLPKTAFTPVSAS